MSKLEKLRRLFSIHDERVLPKIIDLDDGFSTEDLRDDLDRYDMHVAGLSVSVLDGETDHIQSDWLEQQDEGLDARIAATIATVSDFPPECHQVALEYKVYKTEIDQMFSLVRELLHYKL